MDDFQTQFNKAIDEYATGNQYGVSKIPAHVHNGTDSLRVDISNINRFLSNPSDGDTIVFDSATNQWIAGSAGGINASSSGTGVTSIGSGVATKLTLATNAFANGVTWDAANSRLTILTAGQYQVNGLVTYTNIAGANQYTCEIRKNGGIGAVILTSQGGTAGWDIGIIANDIIDLAVGDYLELWTRQISGGNQNVSNSIETHLSIAKV